MVSDVPIRRDTIRLNATVQETGGALGGARNLANLANTLTQKRDQYQAQATENAYLKGQVNLSKKLNDIQKEYESDPEGMRTAIEEYTSGFLSEVSDPAMKARFNLQIEKASNTALARATAKRNAIIDEEARFNNLTALEDVKARIAQVGPGLLSGDDAIAISAAEEMQEILSRGASALDATGADGMPLFNASFRVNQLSDAKDLALQSATESWLDSQPDKVAALEKFTSGELSIQLPDGEGGFDVINVRDSVSPQTASLIERSAQAQIARAEAAIKKQRALMVSNLELAIEMAQDDPLPDPNLVGPPEPIATKAQKLNMILQNIDQSPMFQDADGQIKANQLKSKIFKGLEKEAEDFNTARRGALFASGDLFLNPGNADDVKAFDKYYETIAPELASMPPERRATEIVNLVTNARRVPKALKGEIESLARSQNPEALTEVANLMDLITDRNPQMLDALGAEKTMARAKMINDRIGQGVPPEDAIKVVDELLDPKNEVTVRAASQELADQKVSYRDEALAAFDQRGYLTYFINPFDGLDTEAPGQQAVLDDMSAVYRARLEEQYARTRDLSASKDYAQKFLRRSYATSDINGTKQIMRHAPEAYYSIPGQPNDWMRDQAVTDALSMFKDAFVSPATADKFSRDNLEKNLVILEDPRRTPRTAAEFAPEYRLMLKQEDGTLLDVLGVDERGRQGYWKPDPDLWRAQNVQDAAEKKRRAMEEMEFYESLN